MHTTARNMVTKSQFQKPQMLPLKIPNYGVLLPKMVFKFLTLSNGYRNPELGSERGT